MPVFYHGNDLERLVLLALQGDAGDQALLEQSLIERSHFPGPRMNTALVRVFADAIGRIVVRPDLPPIERLEALLDGWAALPLAAAPVNDPREMLPAAAALAYGRVAVVRPDWWDDEIAKLRRAAADPRWRVREVVAAAVQLLLAADWPRAYEVITDWLASDDPLVIRASAAAIAEPPLLTTTARGEQALVIQTQACAWLAPLPAERRRETGVRVLRQALGYTLSVAIAAAPDAGCALLHRLRRSTDLDLRWIVRENLKKQRLKPYLKTLQAPDSDAAAEPV